MTPAGLMSWTGTASFEFMKLGYASTSLAPGTAVDIGVPFFYTFNP